MTDLSQETPVSVLKKYWGHDAFRPLQEEAIVSVLNKRNTLVLFPTGAGKSICFQVPALIQNGVCLVISPLVALMRDQVKQLQNLKIPAALIDAHTTLNEESIIFDNARNHHLKLLYISPERLALKDFKTKLSEIPISFIVVDEAHCISMWGHDFRPAYLKINEIKELLPSAPILALTATATPAVQKEIIDLLQMDHVSVFQSSFKRSNLSYSVIHTQNKLQELCHQLDKTKGPSIVFTSTRKNAFELSSYLQKKGYPADFFHAGLEASDKIQKQKQWNSSDHMIMVATIAFGMGIDKPNVRKVIHYNMPSTIESYFQEVGRAGRDGKPATGVMLLNENDIHSSESLFKSHFANEKEFKNIIRALFDEFQIAENELTDRVFKLIEADFIKKHKLSESKTRSVLGFLHNQEIIQLHKPHNSAVQIIKPYPYIKTGNKRQDNIIDFLSRNYEGIFHHPRDIDEYKIASALALDISSVYAILTELNTDTIITYQNKKDRSLIFLEPRSEFVTKKGWRKYKDLQLHKWEKLQQMVYFSMNKKTCRNKMLLSYFGEKEKEKCGTCDNCTREKQQQVKVDLLKYIENKPSSIEEITQQFIDLPKETLLHELQYLLDEEFIYENNSNYYCVK